MDEKEIQAWRDIIMTNTVTAIALVKVLTQKGILKDEEVVAAMNETKQELVKKKV
jgi:NaMN:DMB phosphoribosyltransferase